MRHSEMRHPLTNSTFAAVECAPIFGVHPSEQSSIAEMTFERRPLLGHITVWTPMPTRTHAPTTDVAGEGGRSVYTACTCIHTDAARPVGRPLGWAAMGATCYHKSFDRPGWPAVDVDVNTYV